MLKWARCEWRWWRRWWWFLQSWHCTPQDLKGKRGNGRPDLERAAVVCTLLRYTSAKSRRTGEAWVTPQASPVRICLLLTSNSNLTGYKLTFSTHAGQYVVDGMFCGEVWQAGSAVLKQDGLLPPSFAHRQSASHVLLTLRLSVSCSSCLSVPCVRAGRAKQCQ